jgi:hypothetical protein
MIRRTNQNLSEASAEMLINYLYPEIDEQWSVQNMGTFYRNYTRDLLTYDDDSYDLQLARDGFVKLLPQGLLFTDQGLKKGQRMANIKRQNAKLRMLNDLFQPFDTFAFRRKLAIERQVSELLDIKLEYVLKTYFRYDLAAETNEYVRDVARLLPFVSQLRGDLLLVRNILASLFECQVECHRGRFSETDNTKQWLPMITYELLIEKLTAEEYRQLAADIEPLKAFIEEWLIPFDVKCNIVVKWHNQLPQTNMNLILDYNSEVINEK